MSASSKYNLSSGNPDRPLHASGRRGTYGVENPLLSSLPSMTRSISSVAQGDVLNFFQCVRLDPMSLVEEHKLNKPAGFKRLASASVGFTLEGSLPASSKSKPLSSPSPEDLRRLKSGARESGTKARERVKIFNDCLSVVNKCFPIIPSRKRSRLDALSNDRSNTLLSIDRSASEMGSGKMGSQNHASTMGLDLELQKSKVKTKNATPSKRARTSIAGARMDVRAHCPARPSGTKDKERCVVRLSNSSAVQGDDRTLSIAVDGWESPKMKKKRTGIKLDIAASSMASKPVDAYRVSKQGMQPRLSAEARPRLTDAHGFRCRIADGGVGVGKTEATLQTSSGIHSSISRGDADNSSLLTERRGHQEKERVNLKIVNRGNSREDLSSGSPTSGPKLNSNVRAPRSSSVGGVSKLHQAVQRSTSSNDRELSSCTSKLPGLLGANNHKHEPSPQPSSSPVANWVQRPQKISRTARRNIILPILPRNDDIPAEDETSGLMVNERCFPALSPQQVRIKPDNSSPAALSESEESGANEIKSRDMNKKCNEIDENSGHYVQKMSTLLLPQRKSKAMNGNDHGDGVRRQGRTGRRFTSPRSLLPLTVEKLGSVGTNKQIKSSRLGLEKTERAGGVPTRKLSDRKAYTREKHIAINMPADLLVGSGDGREVLFAAANAVINTAQALSSPFWKKMEQLFLFISDADISYLKDQINLDSAVDTPAPAPLDADSYTFMPNGYGLSEFGIEEIERGSLEPSLAHSAPPNGISLYQRLIAALILEEEHQELLCGGKELKYDVYARCDMGFELSGYPTSNGYGVNTNRRSSYEPDQAMQDHNNVSIPDVGFSPRYDHLQNGLLAEQLMPATICTQYQYHNTSISAKLLMEVQSIGIFPNLVSGDKEISGDISRLDEKFQEQVSRKKDLLGKLLNSASEAKELQEREFEGRALDKLVGLAYEKYMSCWGPNARGMKSVNVEMAKQAALAFVKWSLERYEEFEVTGKSCFSEPLYRDMFLSGVSLNCINNNESGKHNLDTFGSPAEVRSSAPMSTQQSQQNPSNQEICSDEVLLLDDPGTEQHTDKEDSWSNRVKKRELLLDDDGGTIRSAKGRRSEREREGKGNLSRNGTIKIGGPTVKGERKSKAKPNKQKTAHLADASVNGTLGKISEIDKDKNEYNPDMLEDPIDLSALPLPEMDGLGVPSDLAGQGDDLGSWFGDEDHGLQDHDYLDGLMVPRDDLADLSMLGV